MDSRINATVLRQVQSVFRCATRSHSASDVRRLPRLAKAQAPSPLSQQCSSLSGISSSGRAAVPAAAGRQPASEQRDSKRNLKKIYSFTDKIFPSSGSVSVIGTVAQNSSSTLRWARSEAAATSGPSRTRTRTRRPPV